MGYKSAVRTAAEALKSKKGIRILAMETSCDETAAAIVEDGRRIISSTVFSQIDLHAMYGGVVPEIASRAHMEACTRVTDEALRQAGMRLQDIDALAVTYGPGLVGALLTGVSYMKGLAFGLGKPLLAVNHIEGHVSANYLTHPGLMPPFICLVVSGGHSHLVGVRDYGNYALYGSTADDAAGEAFDKAARSLGLPYPGGPKLDELADKGDPDAFPLPQPKVEGEYDFSFSGLKTAFINILHHMKQTGTPVPKADLAASFRKAVVRQLTDRSAQLLRALGPETPGLAMAMAGGVSANSLLRAEMAKTCSGLKIPLYMPRPDLCTDNAAMIGSAAYYAFMRGELADLSLNACPALRFV